MSRFSLMLLQVYARSMQSSLVRQTQRLETAQSEFLLKLLRHHRHTSLGQTWGLDQIHSVAAFRDRVPILPYEAYLPYVERIAQGEANVLTPDRVAYINLTSGSTGNKKQVPVTARFQASLRRADMASMGFALDAIKARDLSLGKLFIANSAKLQGTLPSGIPFGPVSVGSLRRGKLLFEQLFSLPFAALEIGDTLARHYVCLLFALRNPELRCVVANFPMLVLRACRYLETHAAELIQDLERGTIADWLVIEPELRSVLEQRSVPDPKRAAELRAILETAGRLTPALAWPELSYIMTARGGTSDFYLESFPDYFGKTPVFGGVYGTAEGTFGVFPDFEVDGSILAIESGFFEFIPQDQWQVEQPKTLLPSELTVGDRYRILVTSYSGFYRYDIGDVIEVVGFYHQAPLIVFRHRRGGLLSSTTEKTTEFHVTQVMQMLQQEFHLRLDDFCITLSEQEFPAAYLVNIELAADQTLDDPIAFLDRFDYWMAHFNNPYGTVRQSQVPPPRLRLLAPGSFAAVRQRQVDRGMFDSQLKIPHITEDRHFLVGLPIEQEVSLIESVR